MKQLLLLVLILSTAALAAQGRHIRKFIRQHNDGPENVSVTIPGFVIDMATGIGLMTTDDEEAQLALRLAKSFGTTRFLMFNGNEFKTRGNMRKLLRKLEGEHDFERWATVRASSGEQVELSVLMQDKVVRQIVAFVHAPDDGQTVFLHAKTDFTAEELGHVINELSK